MLTSVRPFSWMLLVFQLFLVIVFFAYVGYDDKPLSGTDPGSESSISSYYWYFIHIVIMMPIGFGYLMTFLREYRYSSVGFTFVLTALIFQWSLLVIQFWQKVKSGDWSPFKWTLVLFIMAMYSVASHLITLGAIIGKVSLEQLMVVQIPQTVMYGFNWYVCQLLLQATDVGGSLVIHVFGCYYGIAATIFLSRKPMKTVDEEHEPGYTSDILSMIGTIFLWTMWPSFNAALALPHLQYRVIINTVLSLCAATVVTFVWSPVLRKGKLLMEDVQNATLAGGVAIGCVADLCVTPGGALTVGFVAATLSCFGFRFLSPCLARKGIHDSCGINNLHGMPGLIGGITSVIVTRIADAATYGADDYSALMPHGSNQWMYQLAAIGITLGIAIASGLLFGFAASLLPAVKRPFHDSHSWHLPASHQVIPKNTDAIRAHL